MWIRLIDETLEAHRASPLWAAPPLAQLQGLLFGPVGAPDRGRRLIDVVAIGSSVGYAHCTFSAIDMNSHAMVMMMMRMAV